MGAISPLVQERRRATFDVICAGKPVWKIVQTPEGPTRTGVRFRSGILSAARLLTRAGLRVGLATVLDDDRLGRAWLQKAAALGIDVGGVRLSSPATSLVVVDAVGDQSCVLSEGETEHGLDVPPEWSSQVILLSGLSPVTSMAAALCKAARRARRQGTLVVLDLAASLRLWAGRDPRTILMVLREVDVVRCSFADLAVLGMDGASVRKAMRSSATLVINDAKGALAAGTFGEVRCVVEKRDGFRAQGPGDSCTAAICAEWARPCARAVSTSERWHRVFQLWISAASAA
jgi:sugar/nucleoside kinase (ribokinase family)